ncbi:6897_t:CDS:2 [Gigaspora margarita]|uniref:6897_t:CDS:1 n=1 Tax=Gigaspora margarita TaxID=4874 RepID=A0ABN7VA73_GIGMA|nr:6897_t:CDS:2 [Gigaspora margarita]
MVFELNQKVIKRSWFSATRAKLDAIGSAFLAIQENVKITIVTDSTAAI